MSDLAISEQQLEALPADKRDETLWRTRIEQAEADRKQHEPSWMVSLAYVAGNQWMVWDRHSRTLKDVSEVDDRYQDVDLYVADIITEQRAAALGELQSDSDRPELLAPEGGEQGPDDESVQAQINRALGHVWDFEVDGDTVLMDARRKCVDIGVAAIRVHYDKTAGNPVKSSNGDHVSAPLDDNGQPITDATKAREYVAGVAGNGAKPARFEPLYEGKHCWSTGSAFNLLPPPGVPHEKDFPYEIWREAVHIDDLKDEFPTAADLTPDSNIASALGTEMSQQTGQTTAGRLRDHVWLYRCYERASRKHPKGRVVILAGQRKKLLRVIEELPYRTVDGCWHSGIVYLHWWRLTDRFWSRGLIETLKDPQRMTNRTATQAQEIIDRSMPFGIVAEGMLPEKPSGTPGEWLELKKGDGPPPEWHQGPGPGPWMEQHRERLMEDAQHASTLSALKLGENPSNADTYSALALLQDQEQSKRATIRSDQQLAVAHLVELTVHDITRYWPESKQIIVAGGPDNKLQATTFSKSVIPPLYLVRPAKGASRPRNQASQLQLVSDIWNAAVNSTATVQNPLAWVEWLKSSYLAGEPLPLPSPPADNQLETAQRENEDLLAGQNPAVAYWDNPAVHVPLHRHAEDQARLAGDLQALDAIEQHIQEHQQVALDNQQQIMAHAQPATPGLSAPPPGAPAPGPPPPPSGPPPPAPFPPGQ